MSAVPLVARSLTPKPCSNLAAADIGNISRITKTHKSLSITPKPLPDLKQSMAFEVSAFGVHGRGEAKGGRLARATEAQKENGLGTVVERMMESEAKREGGGGCKTAQQRWRGKMSRTP